MSDPRRLLAELRRLTGLEEALAASGDRPVLTPNQWARVPVAWIEAQGKAERSSVAGEERLRA